MQARYGTDPQPGETLILRYCHDEPQLPFVCLFRKTGVEYDEESVAVRDHTRLTLHCPCCPDRVVECLMIHKVEAPGAPPRKVFVDDNGTEHDRIDFLREHLTVRATVISF